MMERVFMGLAVKQEISDEAIDAAPIRSAALMQWPLSNKSHSQPQLLSFHGSYQERPKTGFDSLASAGLITITTTGIDSDHKSYPVAMQKNIVDENQGGVRYSVTTYSTDPMKATASSPLSPQPISAIPMVNPIPSMPWSNPIVGTRDIRHSPKISTAPAQLTIFYKGSVSVYGDVCADKAEAIMLLAGNGPQAASRPSILESFVVNHPYGAAAHRSSPAAKAAPISVSQSTIGWAGALSNNAASSNKVEPLNVANSPASASATFLPSSSIPQFRRKSLARFLEKRKERVVKAAPYPEKESPECNSSGSCSVAVPTAAN